jgi:hypothetical protein
MGGSRTATSDLISPIPLAWEDFSSMASSNIPYFQGKIVDSGHDS